MSIEVVGLTKVYGEQKAVNDVTFSIKSGEIVGFLGPNGAGKSTTMKMLTCFLLPSSGIARVCGFDTFISPMEVKRKIGYLPEHNPLYLDMYVKEYLHFVAGIYGLKKEAGIQVKNIIGNTGLSPEQNKKIGALSKGYRQRVGLAQAMLHNPKVLILDEPTSGLDPNQITDIRKLITEFGKDRTVMLSTHIMQEVEAMCDRVIIINNGQIVVDDATDSLQKRFKSSLVLNVEFKNTATKEQLSTIAGVEMVTENGKNRWKLLAIKGTDLRELVFKFAVETGNVILEQNEEEQRLEEIFQHLTKTK
ncbi:MAG: gliding motility-associated ABC transporter ATP-binding subunit GldA [Bacteroidia bacterium]